MEDKKKILIIVISVLLLIILFAILFFGREDKKEIENNKQEENNNQEEILENTNANQIKEMGDNNMEKFLNKIQINDEELYTNYSTSGYFKDSKMPKDSWGNKFIYINEEGSVELISLGADKKEGGKDEGADIKMSGCK
jgi:general secretion pathway protein G